MTVKSLVDAPTRYRLLLAGLEAARAAAGGELDPEDESARVAELDAAWRSMTDEEQDEFERSVARKITREWRRGRSVRLPPRPPGGRRWAGLVWFVLIIAYGAVMYGLGRLR